MRRAFEVVMLLVAASCATFDAANDTPAGGDAGADGGPDGRAVETRDVRVAVEWPSATALDPLADDRAAEIRVVLTDAADPTRRVEQTNDHSQRGPFEFKAFASTANVDVTVEVLAIGTQRLIGYGETRAWDLGRATTIDVAARRRLAYFANVDTADEELRVIDLAPPELAEPAMADFGEPLELPASHLSDAAITGDGRLLAVGAHDTNADGVVAIYETSTHAKVRAATLDFSPSHVVALSGHDVFVSPSFESPSDRFARVNLDTGVVDYLPSGFQGGKVAIESAILAPDGARVIAAGELLSTTGTPKPYVFVHDLANKRTASVEIAGEYAATSIRFTPDAKRIVLLAYARASSDDVSTGAILFFDPSTLILTSSIPMSADTTRPTGLVVHPAGHRAFVSTDTMYPTSGPCCGEFDVVDLDADVIQKTYPATNSGPEYRIGSAMRLPYGARRAIAGLTDDGNNVHGAFVELVDAERPVDLTGNVTGVHTVAGLVTPFGTRL